MSFQGDVAGIGLGELLQSLARGGQDGVLRLFGTASSSVLGVKGGLLFLLPGPDEDDEALRHRCQRAWCDDPDPQLEAKRREDIANASRLETLYRLLGAQRNVHFRFEPGPVPLPEIGGRYDDGGPSVPWGRGLGAEYVLLEHARLSDEAQDVADRLGEHEIPRMLDVGRAPEALRGFAEHCTGRSTISELADRMGWTQLQTKVALAHLVQAGALRLSEPRELLVAAQYELAHKRRWRGVDRLTGWVWLTAPGPPFVGDAQLLLNEWAEGELADAVADLDPRVARALLRKLDLADPDRAASVGRWKVLRQAHRRDNVAAVHLAAFQLDDSGQAQSTALTDLMRLIRAFDEEGKTARALALLRLATAEVPESDKSRIELALQMLEMGLQQEGVGWLLDVARDLIDDGKGDRAIGPLKEVLREIPGLPEAREMLEEAQNQGLRRRRRKMHLLVGAATAVLLSGVAAVQYNARLAYEAQLAEVTDRLDDPREALAVLHRNFPEDESPRVRALREQLSERKAELEQRLYEDWIARFEAVRAEVESGDPLGGLERTLAMPPPPELDHAPAAFPARSEILNLLANRIEALSEEVNPAVDAAPDELESEARVLLLLEDVLERSRPHVGEGDVEAFHVRVTEIEEVLEFRREDRKIQRTELVQRELEERQDLLLEAARSHAEAGDLGRASSAFERLTALDATGELGPLLADEIGRVRRQLDAVARARELSEAGDHEAAIAELEEHCEEPSLFALPWRLRTQPRGADVRTSDGEVHTAPCVLESRLGQPLELELRLVGHEPRTLTVEAPGDLEVHMHRVPEREWNTGHRVDAAPVPIGDDHVAADRFGRIGRITGEGTTLWTLELDTLAGIARTPVFLPERPGQLLVVAEDSRVWLVDAVTGEAQGPWEHEAPPADGPTSTRHGVSVRFADDRIALWTDRLAPAVYDAVSTYDAERRAISREDALPGSVSILRRSPEAARRLDSKWTDWRVEARRDEYAVTLRGSAEVVFTVRREGDWSYVGWEAPNALIPEGRLWVSDRAGLRCFLPVQGVMAARGDEQH